MVGKFNIYINDKGTIKNIFSQSKSEPNSDWKNLLINIQPEGPYQVVILLSYKLFNKFLYNNLVLITE